MFLKLIPWENVEEIEASQHRVEMTTNKKSFLNNAAQSALVRLCVLGFGKKGIKK